MSSSYISKVCGGLYGGYEAEVEIEHIFNQEAHYGNEDYSLFWEEKSCGDYGNGCYSVAESVA